jgi:transposase
MPPRTLPAHEKNIHPPGPCPHCGNPIKVGEAVYQELDAPATPNDVQRAKEGKSHAVVTKTAHWACNPRAALPSDSELIKNLGMTG